MVCTCGTSSTGWPTTQVERSGVLALGTLRRVPVHDPTCPQAGMSDCERCSVPGCRGLLLLRCPLGRRYVHASRCLHGGRIAPCRRSRLAAPFRRASTIRHANETTCPQADQSTRGRFWFQGRTPLTGGAVVCLHVGLSWCQHVVRMGFGRAHTSTIAHVYEHTSRHVR
jgi:hypothetical protein